MYMKRIRKKKGLNKKSLPKFHALPQEETYSRRLLRFTSKSDSVDEQNSTLSRMEEYLRIQKYVPEIRPLSYYDPTGPQALYVVIEDREDIWNRFRCQAHRCNLFPKRLEREGIIPPQPEELLSSEIGMFLLPLLGSEVLL